MLVTSGISKVTEDSARNGFFLFSGAALSGIIMAISAMLIGRFLGSELYGQYSIIVVIPSILVLFTDLGMVAGITKFSASFRSEGKEEHVPIIIRHAFFFRMAVGIIVSILSIVFASYLALLINRPDLSFYVQLVSVSIVFQVIYTSSNAAFVGLDKSEYTAISENTQAIVKTVLQIVLILLGLGLTGALFGYVAGFFVAAIFGGSLLFTKFLNPRKNIQPSFRQNYAQSLKLLASYGMPVYLSVVLTGLFPLYQQVVLAFFASDVAIGNFKAAYNFILLLTILTTTLTTTLLPAFSKIESSQKQIIFFFKRVIKYISLLIIPLATVVILFSQQIVYLIYGPTYTSAALYLSLSAIIYFFVVIGHLSLIGVFNGLGKTRLTMKVTLVNFLILVILTPLLAPIYGVIGVIAAGLVASMAAACYSAYVTTRHLKLEFEFKLSARILIATFLASILPSVLLFFTSLHYMLLLAIGVALYLLIFLTLIPLLRVVTAKELDELRRITGRIPVLGLLAKPVLAYLGKIMSLKLSKQAN